MIYGYARVLLKGDSFLEQLSALEEAGVNRCNIVYEVASIRKINRLELTALIKKLKPYDTLIVQRLDRLCSNTKNLVDIITSLETNKVRLVSIEEGIDSDIKSELTFYDSIRRIYDFERNIISECTKQGILRAKSLGHKSGRKRKDSQKVQHAIDLYNSKDYTIDEIEIMSGVSRSTLYRYLKKADKEVINTHTIEKKSV